MCSAASRKTRCFVPEITHPDCNAYKGPNLTSVDPESNECVHLFNPRIDRWAEHFAVSGPLLNGLTPIGCATVTLLQMNAPERVEMRAELLKSGIAD